MNRRVAALRHNPLVIDPEDCDPLLDDIGDEEQEMRDDRGAFEVIGSGVKRRKPAIHDDF